MSPWTQRGPTSIDEAKLWLRQLAERRKELEAQLSIKDRFEANEVRKVKFPSDTAYRGWRNGVKRTLINCERHQRRLREWVKRVNIRMTEGLVLEGNLDTSGLSRELALLYLATKKLLEQAASHPEDFYDDRLVGSLQDFLREKIAPSLAEW